MSASNVTSPVTWMPGSEKLSEGTERGKDGGNNDDRNGFDSTSAFVDVCNVRRETMSRYIDADALIAELQKDEERFDKEAEDCRKNSRNYTDCYMQAMSSRADGIRDAIVEVYDAPTIDIVHCRECKYFIDNLTEDDTDETYDACRWDWKRRIPKPDDFCSYGEREGE